MQTLAVYGIAPQPGMSKKRVNRFKGEPWFLHFVASVVRILTLQGGRPYQATRLGGSRCKAFTSPTNLKHRPSKGGLALRLRDQISLPAVPIASPTTSASAATCGPLFTRARLINRKWPALKVLLVEHCNSLARIFL
jgi:hypothetical protein